MRSQDLPNARNMQSHLVRPKSTAPPKQNAFQKFFGKITGRSKSTTSASATVPSTPPVPPTVKEPTPAPPAGHSIADGRRSSPAQTPARPAAPKPLQLPATIPLDARPAEPSFLQPGAAPAFMNSASAAAARATAAAKSAAAAIPDDPLQSLDAEDSADVLDLEAVARSATAAVEAAIAPTQPAASNTVPATPSAPEPKFEDTLSAAGNPKTSDKPAADDPFTGVGLEESSEDAAALVDEPAPPMNEFDPALPAISADKAQPAEAAANVENSVTAPSEPLQSVDAERMRIAAEQADRRRQLERIQSRADLTGFKGFCPVALRDQRQLVDAQPQIQSTFGLQTWTFSTDEARIAFEANPQRYAPVAGGHDTVILSTRQEEVPGKLDFALWYRGRLHLFSCRETMASFLENPQQFAVTELE
jgi:YHS domain-containing protein